MKKTELRKLIKEEISNVLKEELITKRKLYDLMKNSGTADVNLWHITKLIQAGILQDSEKMEALKAVDYDFS